MATYKYDELDAYILLTLSSDPLISYVDIANKFGVSVGTIHVRLDKMRQAGVIQKAKISIVAEKLGYEIIVFIGITLNSAKSYKSVIEKLTQINEVVEAYYTTGRYSIFIKVLVDSVNSLHRILTEKIQSIDEIQSTDTIVSLDCPINRPINLCQEDAVFSPKAFELEDFEHAKEKHHKKSSLAAKVRSIQEHIDYDEDF